MPSRLLLGLEFDGEYDPRVRAELEQLVAALQVWQAKVPNNDAGFLVDAASDSLSNERVAVNSPTIRVDFGRTGQVRWHSDQAAFGAGYMLAGGGGGDGEGEPGPPGIQGKDGAAGAQGRDGVTLFPFDGEDGDQFGFPGPKGDTGATGAAGASGAWTQLAQIVTASSATTVDFTSISGSYNTLKVLAFHADTATGTGRSTVRVILNNDSTAANYTSAQRAGAQNGVALVSALASSTKGVQVGSSPNAGTTGATGSLELTLIGYAGTTFQKTIAGWFAEEDDGANGTLGSHVSRWKSTSAVTRITFQTDGTAFTDGSTFTLYGVN